MNFKAFSFISEGFRTFTMQTLFAACHDSTHWWILLENCECIS